MSVLSKIYYIYFTPLPYAIYSSANNHSNLAWAGIGLGLIDSQRMFWAANIGMVIIVCNQNNYLNICLFTVCSLLYISSFMNCICSLFTLYAIGVLLFLSIFPFILYFSTQRIKLLREQFNILHTSSCVLSTTK